MSENFSSRGLDEPTPGPAATAPPEPALMDAALGSEVTLGLLHEVNNSMTGLFFTIESALESAELPPQTREDFNGVMAGLRSAQAIIDRASEIHLGVREESYHEAQALLDRQHDLLKIVLPKSAKLEVTPAPGPLYLHVDEAGFRVLLLQLAYRLRCTLGRPPALTVAVRATTFSGTGDPAVAFVFRAAADEIQGSLPSHGLDRYGAEITVLRLPSGAGLEVALLLPRVELGGTA